MEKIFLKGFDELKALENLPEIPQLVKRYLDLKDKQTKGKYFRIVIEEKSRDSGVAGIAYLNELRIENKIDGLWHKVYSTGMMQYRGAYAYEIDNWDLFLKDPAIIEESKNEVIYGIRTGAGNIKIYRFRHKNKSYNPETLVVFNMKDYTATQERIELLQKVISDPEAFHLYVSKGLKDHWHTAYRISKWDSACRVFDITGKEIENTDEIAEKAYFIILLAKHYDRDYDALVDYYRFYFWVRDKGVGVSNVYKTGSRHPNTRFYTIELKIEKVTFDLQNRILVDITVSNYASYSTPRTYPIPTLNPPWKETQSFLLIKNK